MDRKLKNLKEFETKAREVMGEELMTGMTADLKRKIRNKKKAMRRRRARGY